MDSFEFVSEYIEARRGTGLLSEVERLALLESFTAPYDWMVGANNANGVEGSFITDDGREIHIMASKYNGNRNVAELEFSDRENYMLTGGGDAFRIFATMVSFAKSLLSNPMYKIKSLTFTAVEPSRRKLYARMLKKLAKPYLVAKIDARGSKKKRFAVSKTRMDMMGVEKALVGWKVSDEKV